MLQSSNIFLRFLSLNLYNLRVEFEFPDWAILNGFEWFELEELEEHNGYCLGKKATADWCRLNVSFYQSTLKGLRGRNDLD